MSRIADTFATLKAAGRHALIPYITAGDPDPHLTVPLLFELVDAGANILEIGVPFSDPMADGPVIQRAGERALAKGVTLASVLEMVRTFRATNTKTPVVLMGYANPIEAMGRQPFVAAARAAGVDGLIIVDLPPEECETFAFDIRAADMDLIFLLAPTSTPARIQSIVRLASGYLYYVSLTGVTGAGNIDLKDVLAHLEPIRRLTPLPIGVGFGIRDGATARAICTVADAAIIGSRLIQEIEAAGADRAVRQVGLFVRAIRTEMDNRS
ncbi:MAG: tryptophan synthase subunit alpha [Betaproteobacteria bacterium]|nr:tryptophan synthase subunit alpha [Betaproteobacteria bacterium]